MASSLHIGRRRVLFTEMMAGRTYIHTMNAIRYLKADEAIRASRFHLFRCVQMKFQ